MLWNAREAKVHDMIEATSFTNNQLRLNPIPLRRSMNAINKEKSKKEMKTSHQGGHSNGERPTRYKNDDGGEQETDEK